MTDIDTPVERGRSPYDLIAQAGRLALADTGGSGLAQAIDTVAMLRSYKDTSHRFETRLGGSTNPPKSVAKRLGLDASRHVYTWNGGNMPQSLANQFAEEISRGEMRAALVVGGEALRTQHGVERAGLSVSWHEDPGGQPELIGDPRRGWNDHEDRHNLRAAITQYPLYENAIRGVRGRSVAEHMKSMAQLMSGFSRVAAANPLATRREGYSAEQLATVNAGNRWIGFPYPRLMVSNAFIDQAAAFIITSVGMARALGIDESKWVYLHGCADGHDHWYTSERFDLHSSPAMRAASRRALEMAGKTIADVRFLDLYSCFPSAVEITCEELGIAEGDARGLTVTGGLVYFGGPGNSYVVMSICEMMRRLRSAPGSFGLVTANGNWVTKHSFGVYSTTPYQGRWTRENPAVLQAQLDALPKAPLTEVANGPAAIETYTVMHDKNGPAYSVVLGRLDSTGERFISNTPADPALLQDLQERESLGRPGIVRHNAGLNSFHPA
ncbi:MAG: acetyl-CoA acetyltransferase [Betaproteobacteria bacterium]|nr:acetyl-CoA acetyltransferase [Betaproteobacteria bacterium]